MNKEIQERKENHFSLDQPNTPDSPYTLKPPSPTHTQIGTHRPPKTQEPGIFLICLSDLKIRACHFIKMTDSWKMIWHFSTGHVGVIWIKPEPFKWELTPRSMSQPLKIVVSVLLEENTIYCLCSHWAVQGTDFLTGYPYLYCLSLVLKMLVLL